MGGIEIKINRKDEITKDHKEMEKEREKEEDLKGPDKGSDEEDREVNVKTPAEMTKKELLEKLKDTEQEAQKNHDLYLRTYAEMENIKKRANKEREDLAKYANESLIKEILPVIDNLQKAITYAQNDNNPSGLVEGLEMTLGGLMKVLEKAGLKEVEAAGKPFDPNFHEAVSQQIDDGVALGHVIFELQKGYLLNGRLIRPSMVVISQGNGNKREDAF